MKKQIGIFLVAALGAVAGGLIVKFTVTKEYYVTNGRSINGQMTSSSGSNLIENPDFMHASAVSTPAVVHVSSYYEVSHSSGFGTPFHGFDFPGGQSTGSGVIITPDGYITTNNHVIKNASKVEVTLFDKRTFTATVIGADPSTDLALLKIDADGLSTLPYGDSDKLQVGEWVLAVGNPFNLTSTVTAGIVSAKGRNLNLLNEAFAIESFIQTDAAVNPGNSGGALINTKAELIGINTAIASDNGSYEGYSFAVPVNIVKKVMRDLKEYGKVQRGLIGVQIQNINSHFAEEKGLKTLDGAYVVAATPDGAAGDAGIVAGDVITAINGTGVSSSSELQEIVGTFSPGDKLNVSVLRGEEKMEFEVTLKSKTGGTSLSAARGSDDEDNSPEPTASKHLGIGLELQNITAAEKTKFELENGVKVKKVLPGRMSEIGIEEGFIITQVNRKKVFSADDVETQIKESDGTVLIEGVTPEGHRQFYSFDF